MIYNIIILHGHRDLLYIISLLDLYYIYIACVGFVYSCMRNTIHSKHVRIIPTSYPHYASSKYSGGNSRGGGEQI